ncbi:MAG TPA: hypothetical protein VLJ68_06085 [Chitinophagaceae bacterium]|nr:hypothetical protein [Chitinophagaceae bacterium]
MKKTIVMVMGIVLLSLSLTVRAQQTYDPKKNPTVTAITSQFEGKLIGPRAPVTINQIFPVIGKYESTNTTLNTEASATAPVLVTSLSISLDEMNKGLVWIDGLPQGRVKAMLRKSPSTYKIPAQTTAEGKEVPEGVLIYDNDANTLNICLGCTYNLENPAVAFEPAPVVEEPVQQPVKKSKKDKSKPVVKVEKAQPWFYSGSKVVEVTPTTPVAGNQ